MNPINNMAKAALYRRLIVKPRHLKERVSFRPRLRIKPFRILNLQSIKASIIITCIARTKSHKALRLASKSLPAILNSKNLVITECFTGSILNN